MSRDCFENDPDGDDVAVLEGVNLSAKGIEINRIYIRRHISRQHVHYIKRVTRFFPFLT